MTFTPRTWVVGEVVTAALLNQELRDQFNSMFAWTSYTPAVTGDGTATLSGPTGWYRNIGGMVTFTAEVSFTSAGSGSANLTVTAPTNIYRGTRQAMSCHAKNVFTSGLASDGCAIARETGTGNVIDEIAVSNDNALNRDGIITGVNLTATSRITISGTYRVS